MHPNSRNLKPASKETLARRGERMKGNDRSRAGASIRQMLLLALNGEIIDDNGYRIKKLRAIAERLVNMAVAGDMAAIKEINDRIDGKSMQALEISGHEGKPIEHVHRTMTAREAAIAYQETLTRVQPRPILIEG